MLNDRLSRTDINHKKQTDEICRLFSTTLQSLAADANAIRQLSSLSTLIGKDDENRQPNMMNRSRNASNYSSSTTLGRQYDISIDKGNDSSPLSQLQSLDRAVSSIEQKVVALRSMISEEKNAIAHFEGSLREEYEAQRLMAENLLQAYQEVQKCEEKAPKNGLKEKQATRREMSSPSMTTHSNTAPQAFDSSANHTPTPLERSTKFQMRSKQAAKQRKDSIDPRVDHSVQPARYNPDDDHDNDRVTFEPVTDEELSRVSRNTRGRIHILDLNEALEEIEGVAEMKFASIKRNSSSFSSASRQRRSEYLKQQRGSSYQDVEVDAHDGHYWVSEQELREKCHFFRNGESTARAILSILCKLRRLRQIPGKKHQVTYICLVRNINEASADEQEHCKF